MAGVTDMSDTAPTPPPSHEAFAEWSAHPKFQRRMNAAAPAFQKRDGTIVTGTFGDIERGTYGRYPTNLGDGARLLHFVFEPALPVLPKSFANTLWAVDYDYAAPFGTPFWRGFWGGAQKSYGQAEHQAGAEHAATSEGAAYRRYVDTCRSKLATAGWQPDEIP
jgi:hypothetical protein